MSRLKLTFGCWNYDRTRALMDASVVPDGIDLNYLNMPVEETFFRMLRHQEFDLAEMSLSSYSVSMHKPERPFVAIPVFPSRMFRHSCIYVNADSGIREAKDLIGKRVGNPEYQMTAPVWIRGILSDHYGVPVDSVRYFTDWALPQLDVLVDEQNEPIDVWTTIDLKMQKAATAISRSASSSTRRLTVVLERMPNTWTPLIFSIRSSSSSAPFIVSTE